MSQLFLLILTCRKQSGFMILLIYDNHITLNVIISLSNLQVSGLLFYSNPFSTNLPLTWRICLDFQWIDDVLDLVGFSENSLSQVFCTPWKINMEPYGTQLLWRFGR